MNVTNNGHIVSQEETLVRLFGLANSLVLDTVILYVLAVMICVWEEQLILSCLIFDECVLLLPYYYLS